MARWTLAGSLASLVLAGCGIQEPLSPAVAKQVEARANALLGPPRTVKLDPQAAQNTTVLDAASDRLAANPAMASHVFEAERRLDRGRVEEARGFIEGLSRFLRFGETLSSASSLDPVPVDAVRKAQRSKALLTLGHGLAVRARVSAAEGRDAEARVDVQRLNALANLAGGQSSLEVATASVALRGHYWEACRQLSRLPGARQRGFESLYQADVRLPDSQAVVVEHLREHIENLQHGSPETGRWVVAAYDSNRALAAFVDTWGEFLDRIEGLENRPEDLSMAFLRWNRGIERHQGVEFEPTKNAAATLASYMVQVRKTEILRKRSVQPSELARREGPESRNGKGNG